MTTYINIMPVEVPKECKDIEPLVRYLEENRFKIKEIHYDDRVQACDVFFQHEVTEGLAKSRGIHFPVQSVISYRIPKGEYEVDLAKYTGYEVTVPILATKDDLSENVKFYVYASIGRDVLNVNLKFGRINNSKLVKEVIEDFYRAEIGKF